MRLSLREVYKDTPVVGRANVHNHTIGPREGIMNKINLGFWRINKWRARSRIKRVPIIAGAWSRARKVPTTFS